MNDFRDEFISKRIVPIRGDIDNKTWMFASGIIGSLLMSGAPDIAVLIESGGGNCKSGLDLYDLVKLYPGRKTGIVISQAKSMASAILQACDMRMSTKHADILIHNMTSEIRFEDAVSPIKFRKWLAQAEVTQNAVYRIYADRSGRKLGEIRDHCQRGECMTADEAIRFGLLDKVMTQADFNKWFLP